MKRALRAVAAVAATAIIASAGATAAAAPGPPPRDRAVHGEEAIAALGDSLPRAAAKNHQTPERLENLLRTDSSMWVDPDDRLFYVDAPAAADPGPDDMLTSAPSLIPDSQAFLLHSNPGSQRTIYLDFDGQLISGTAWNQSYNANQDFTAAPYDTDGNPGSFSATELGVVKSVWQRVADDYASLDVDVTTQEPDPSLITRSGSSDQLYGTRALITSGTKIYSSCGCGGIAYVGAFDWASSHSYYQPAWIFALGVPGAKNIAEAASHEVGHNLGLNHDGAPGTGYYSGHGEWAPVMGVGYYRPISQWSKGEYSGANNNEDDFAVMASHGALTRADDHGDTPAAATLVTGPTFSVTGRITTRADVDAFRVDAFDGPATFNVDPAPTSPDLDASLTLLDSNGATVATNDPASFTVNGDTAGGLNASLSVTLAAGTYTLVVDGVAKGDPATNGYSDYASVGIYTISGTVATGPPPPDFSLTVAPEVGRTIAAGVGTTFTVDLGSVSGFADPVTLSVDGAPTGSSFTDNPPAWNGTTATSTLTIPPDAAAGTYTMTITGDDGNGHTHSATTKLNVGSDFTVAVTPNSAQVVPGQSVNYTAKITRVGSYPSTVALSASGLPAGATAAFTPSTVSPTLAGATSTMKVTATTGTKPGNYTLKVTATGADPDNIVHTVDVGLIVAGFTVSVSQPNVSIARGTSQAVTVTVTAFGSFAGTVSLAINNLPSNTSGSFSPKSLVPTASGTTSTLTITAKSNAAARTKTATIKGSASGATTQVVYLPVTVT